jgi:hypothetical protein
VFSFVGSELSVVAAGMLPVVTKACAVGSLRRKQDTIGDPNFLMSGTFGWFGRYRRLSKDYEHKSSEAWVYIAMIHRMSRVDLPDKNKDDDLMS